MGPTCKVRMHLSGRFRRIVLCEEGCPPEVVRVHLEEFDELVKSQNSIVYAD